MRCTPSRKTVGTKRKTRPGFRVSGLCGHVRRGPGLKPILACGCVSRRLKASLPRLKVGGFHDSATTRPRLGHDSAATRPRLGQTSRVDCAEMGRSGAAPLPGDLARQARRNECPYSTVTDLA